MPEEQSGRGVGEWGLGISEEISHTRPYHSGSSLELPEFPMVGWQRLWPALAVVQLAVGSWCTNELADE